MARPTSATSSMMSFSYIRLLLRGGLRRRRRKLALLRGRLHLADLLDQRVGERRHLALERGRMAGLDRIVERAARIEAADLRVLRLSPAWSFTPTGVFRCST